MCKADNGSHGRCATGDKSPLITLIIPVYNVERYLKECLDSAVGQTYDNLKIIIVDDGSTDSSGAVCDEYAAKYPHITMFHTPNGGLAAARNLGLDNLDPLTEYVAFLDSDDWLEPEALQRLLEAAEESGADMVSCEYFFETPGGRQPAHPPFPKALLTGDEKLRRYIKMDSLNALAWNKLCKAELFADVRYPEGMLMEDVAVTYRLILRAKKVALIPDVLFHYLMRQNSLSRSHTVKRWTDSWTIIRQKNSTMSEFISDVDCHRIMESDCFVAIFVMWVSLGGFTREERQTAKTAVEEMKRFAAERRRNVLSGKGYSKADKLACIAAACDNPAYLWLLNRAFRLSRLPKRKKLFP